MGVETAMVPATLADAAYVAAHLRAVEVEEALAATGRAPLPVIEESILGSAEAWAVRFGGELALVGGVVCLSEGMLTGRCGVVWMATTSAVERRARAFWRLCLAFLPGLLERWDVLVSAIDVRHAQALRWARRLGFRLEEARPFGAAGLPFCHFTVRKEDLAWQP